MKQKMLIFLISCVVILSFTGFDDKKTQTDIHSFNATIEKCEENSMIVRPDEYEFIYTSANAVRVDFINDYNLCEINKRVKITYNGNINESYPAQIGTTKIESID